MATKKANKTIAKKDVEVVELKKLVIKIGDKELELTPEEAKTLKQVLSDLFEESEKIVEKIYVQPYPYFPITVFSPQVIYIEPQKWAYPYITYGTITTTTGNTGQTGNITCTCNNDGVFTCNCAS